ncbi:hypothetical protein LTR53_010492 [Teratosphaeriaceae sp. CCFEE 6253]|nr:hypothetical protein LTR53_010492 [Teratosphaeriaceae sp. CCFEE 6253]
MASTASASNPYTYVKASELSTRSLVSPAEKFAAATSESHHDNADAHTKPVLLGKPMGNYEQAAAAAARDGTGQGAATLSGTDRPGLDRQQSWSMQDRRRLHHEGLIGDFPSGQGYHSTGL